MKSEAQYEEQKVWEALEAAVDAQPSDRGLFHFTMSAWQNASDTVYEDKAADEAELHGLAMRSLQCVLCDSSDQDAADFFAAHGVKW